mgnify:CR=1 FL=1
MGLAGMVVAGASAASAAEPPACAAPAVGLVACIAGRLCSCRFERASPATGLPDGFRWDCGILRPACGALPPATIDPWQGGLPESLAIDPWRPIIRQDSGLPHR